MKNMKKVIPFIFPVLTGFFSGWFIESLLYGLSVIMSPFGSRHPYKFLAFFGINAVVSALVVLVMVLADIWFFSEINDKKKCMFGLIGQACTTILIGFVSWYYAERVLDVVIDVLDKSFWN